MKTVRQQLHDSGVQFGHVHMGKQDGEENEGHPHFGEDRWEIVLSMPGHTRPGQPLLPRAMDFHMWASSSEADVILRDDDSSCPRYIGVRMLEFQAVWKILNIAERVLRSHGDMRSWLESCGKYDAKFPMEWDENPDRQYLPGEAHWHSRWQQEQRWTSELAMVLGDDEAVWDWIRTTES